MANIILYIIIPEHFPLALTDFEMFTFQNSWLWKYRSVMLYNTRNGAIRWQIPDFLSDENSNICISLCLSEWSPEKCYFKTEIMVTEHNIRNGPIRWRISSATNIILEYFIYLLPFSSYSHFKISDIENVDHDHDKQHSQRSHSLGNIRLPIWCQW